VWGRSVGGGREEGGVGWGRGLYRLGLGRGEAGGLPLCRESTFWPTEK
jgi:hypothetical protein